MPTLEGLEQFEAKLNAMSLTVQQKVLKVATKLGAELIRAEMERTAPRLTGALSANEIISFVASQSNAYYVLFRIGPARSTFYGFFDEFGTAHQTAEPFVHPSFETMKDPALTLVTEAFKEAIGG